ncbi:MAG: hypothetical protein IJW92_00545 [Clostridia bacterium]|nr:hypothetical protein [Clostridia bacterium]
MYIIGEPSYATTNWYKKMIVPLKNQARKKRVQLNVSSDPADAAGEACAFVVGGSAAWMTETVARLQHQNCHPIILNDLPNRSLFGRYSCVRTDYNRFMALLATRFGETGKKHTAFYGMNHASFSDIARKNAFLTCFEDGAVFENDGSLRACFDAFYRAHCRDPFDSVICANDFAAVSLLTHLRALGADTSKICITVHSNTQILSHFPEILSVGVDHCALAAAAFEIADCIASNPWFIGMSVTVDYRPNGEEGAVGADAVCALAFEQTDAFYGDAELAELMSIEKLLAECDETDFKIIRHLSENCNSIGESTFLSDNGVKYRIKKMKRICNVASKSEIPKLLKKYRVLLN